MTNNIKNSSCKKIVHINFSFTIGGAENLMVDLLNEQSKFSETHLIIINKLYDKILFDQLNPRVKVYLIKRSIGSRNPFKILAFNRIIWAIKPDIIHCHTNSIIDMLFIFKNKTVLTIHDVQIDIGKLGKYNKLVSISEAVKTDVENRSNQTLHPITVYNAIDFSRIQQKRSFSLNNSFRIIQISRLMYEKKGQDVLLKATNILIHRYLVTNLVVDLVGEGESKQFLLDLIKKLGLEKEVQLIEGKERTWIYENLKNYDLLVQPSRYEGFGITIIEAMSANVPVIASKLDGPREILCDGEFGGMFESEDAEGLALQILEMINQYKQETIALQAKKAYDHCMKYFSMPGMIEGYSLVYDEIK